MAKFSERYGYTKASSVIICEEITEEIQNAIYNCYSSIVYDSDSHYRAMERFIWDNFLNKRSDEFPSSFSRNNHIIQNYIINADNKWYSKLDIIEASIQYFYSKNIQSYVHKLSASLNYQFKRLNFAYRIVDNQIVEITSEEEIKSIEEATESSIDSVKHHLGKALELYAKKPTADYQNSIKESISAVEALSRSITGEKTLNFRKMEEKGLKLPSTLRKAFENLYGYTNDEKTGIRHALMDDENKPDAEEALFMLVSCSAFINYINKKMNR